MTLLSSELQEAGVDPSLHYYPATMDLYTCQSGISAIPFGPIYPHSSEHCATRCPLGSALPTPPPPSPPNGRRQALPPPRRASHCNTRQQHRRPLLGCLHGRLRRRPAGCLHQVNTHQSRTHRIQESVMSQLTGWTDRRRFHPHSKETYNFTDPVSYHPGRLARATAARSGSGQGRIQTGGPDRASDD